MNTFSIGHRWWRFCAAVTLTLGLTACGANTHFLSTWSPQNAQPVSPQGMKIATVFFNSNESIRRTGEDVAARELARIGSVAFPSYELVPENPDDREAAKRKLEQAGVDAVLSMRVVARERVIDYAPNYWTGTPYYGSLWGYWGHGWSSAQDNSFLGTDVVVGVETLLYSLKDEKLLWAGMSETFDADDVESAVKSIARKAVDKMDDDAVLTNF
jgi:hypothetical protein